MKSSALLSLLLVVFILLFPAQAFADGKAFSGRDYYSLNPVAQNEQVAAISHRDGIEKMIIAVNFEAKDSDKALWIFPVPGTPDQTKVDVAGSFPGFSGIELQDMSPASLRFRNHI